jgi:hypothetical protein
MAQIRAAGISWFREEDYPRILEIMTDSHVLPPTYELWREKAERTERNAKAGGMIVIRAIIDPAEFLTWCAREGLNVDAKARTAFAADFAARQVKATH